MTLFDKSNVVQISDNDCIISKNPKIRSSLWRSGDTGYLLVNASWCPHCQSKVPMWKKLANEINRAPETNFIIMASDIETETPLLASESGITSIPTLFFVLEDGSLKKIESGRSGPQTTDWSEQDLRSRIPPKDVPKKSSTTPKKSATTPKKSATTPKKSATTNQAKDFKRSPFNKSPLSRRQADKRLAASASL